MLWFLISNFIFPEKTNGHLVTRIFWTREKISNTQICYRVTVLNNLNKRDHKNYFWKDVSLTIVKFQLKISVILLTFLRKKASQGFFYLYLYICLCILFFFFFFCIFAFLHFVVMTLPLRESWFCPFAQIIAQMCIKDTLCCFRNIFG